MLYLCLLRLILSKMQMGKLSVFLDTEKLVLNNICHLTSENSMWYCSCFVGIFFRNKFQMYSFSVISSLYTPFKRLSLLNGQFVLVLQLHFVFFLFLASKIFLLCELIIFLILDKELSEISIVYLLKSYETYCFFENVDWEFLKTIHLF